MAEKDKTTPLPLPKKKKVVSHGGSHGGSWKVAYADFVTAMLALFIVLWILSQNEEVKKAVDAYFTDPVAFNKEMKARGNSPIPTFGLSRSAEPPPAEVKPDEERAKEAIDKIKEKLMEAPALSKIADQVDFQITPEGILIEVKDTEKFDFFPVGSFTMSREFTDLLHLLSPEIATLNYPVIITGHTDRRAYGNEKYTNWELSADRANSVRREMIKAGLPTDLITQVRSYADTQLKSPDDPYAPENRRVSILLKHDFMTKSRDAKLDSLKQKAYADSVAKSKISQAPVLKPH
jgi:chemotaxis protein MotB